MRGQTNLCMLVYVLRCLCESVCVHGLLTRVCSWHFAAISFSPATSEAGRCGGDGHGLDDTYGIEGHGEVRVSKCHLRLLDKRLLVLCSSTMHCTDMIEG